MNLYEYVGGEPVGHWDPDGRQKKSAKAPPAFALFDKDINGFTKNELNEALYTLFGEISAAPHAKLEDEAHAVASTIFNRRQMIIDSRIATAKTSEARDKAKLAFSNATALATKAIRDDGRAQRKLKSAEARVKRAREGLKKATDSLATAKQSLADLKARQGGRRPPSAGEVKKAEQKVAAAGKTLTEASTNLTDATTAQATAKADADKAGADLTKARADMEDARKALVTATAEFRAADDSRIAAESFMNESKRKGAPLLSEIVAPDEQYKGHAGGKELLGERSTWSGGTLANQEARWAVAKKAVENLAKNPSGTAPYVEFHSNRKGARTLKSGQVRIGGNDFWR